MSAAFSSVESAHSAQFFPLHAEKEKNTGERKNRTVGKTVRTPRSVRSNFRQPGHSYDCTKPVAWPSIVLADAEKYGQFMTEIALRKLHSLNRRHSCELCPICQATKQEAA
jgi:hypothetical protein